MKPNLLENKRIKSEKDFQFMRLCYSLVKQGFSFDKSKDLQYTLIISIGYIKKLFQFNTKLPFVESLILIEFNKEFYTYKFKQSIDLQCGELL